MTGAAPPGASDEPEDTAALLRAECAAIGAYERKRAIEAAEEEAAWEKERFEQSEPP